MGRSFLFILGLLAMAALLNGHNLLYVLVAVLMAILALGVVIPLVLTHLAAVRLTGPQEWYASTPMPVWGRVDSPAWGRGGVEARWLGGTWWQEGEQACQVDRRGWLLPPLVEVRSEFPWGVVVVTRDRAPQVGTVRGGVRTSWPVFPRVKPLNEEEAGRLMARFAATSRSPHEPVEELSSVRLYHPGDEWRRIHWKASAKRQTLVVKEFESAPDHIVALALPSSADEGTAADRERVISDLASLVAHVIGRERLVQLRVGAWATPFGTGRSHLLELLQVLSLLP